MAHDPSAFIQEYFQIRSGDTAGLNADTGWAAGENVNATLGTGVNVRVRLKVRETAGGADSVQFKMQGRFNAGTWVDADIIGSATSVPCVICRPSDIFADGDATSTELLTNTSTYVNGEGVAAVIETGNILTGSYSLTSEETEFEYCFFIPAFIADPARDQIQALDTIELRMVESDGTVFGGTYTNPTITVSETAGYVGFTSIETSSKVVHVDSNDSIYIFAEDAEDSSSNPERVVLKSADRGATWRIIDDANHPSEVDWEGMDLVVASGIGYMGSQLNNDAYHDQFNFSDAASNQDTWQVTDQAIKTGITRDDQMAAMVRRAGDGSMVAFWEELVSGDRRIFYSVKNGSWASEVSLDTTASTSFSFAKVVLGDSDIIHIIYQDVTNFDLFYKTLNTSDVLSGRSTVNSDVEQSGSYGHGIDGLVLYDSSGTERIVVAFKTDTDSDVIHTSKSDDGGAWSSSIAASDHTVEHSAQGGEHSTADLVVDGTDLYVIYADLTNKEIWLAKNADYGGAWDTAIKIVPDVICHWVKGFVFSPSDGSTQLGIFYEDETTGFPNGGWYVEYELAAGGNFQAAAGVLTPVGILSKETSKASTGSVTSAGILVKQAAKAFTGSVTAAGILATSKIALLAIGGVITAAGVLIKQTNKSITGSVTQAGVLIKQTAKAFTGSLTASGTIIKQTGKIVLGSLTPSGVLATSKATLLSISGSLTPSGILIRQTGKIVLGSLTASGTLIKQTSKAVLGSLTATGSLVKRTAKSFIGSITTVGSLATQKISGGYFQVAGGVLTMSGIVVRQTSKLFTGSVTPIGSLIKRAGKVLSGSLTPSGILAAAKATLLSVSGSLTPSGLLVRQTGKVVLGSLTASGTLTRQTAKIFVGSLTAAGSLVKQTAKSFIGSVITVGSLATQKIAGGYFQAVGGTVTMTGTLTRQTSKIFAGSITAAGILAKRTVKAFTGSITAVGSLVTQKTIFQVISGVLTMAGVLVRQTNKQTAGIITMTGSITKRISKSFTGVITAIGTLARQILGLPVPAARIYAIESENRVYAVAAEIRIYAIASENRVYPIPG